MDKARAKLLLMSILSPFILGFQNNPKIGFLFEILNELIINDFDRAWDIYVKKNGMRGVDALPPDKVDDFITHFTGMARAIEATAQPPAQGAVKP